MNNNNPDSIINIWTVYDTTTKDYPGLYVARLFKNDEATDKFFTHGDLGIVRQWILDEAKLLGDHFHLYRLNRQERDDPVILETWA